MSKQFTIITKDGSKWLRPINVTYPNADDYEDGNEPHPEFARADAVIYEERTRPVPYIGSHPEGTALDESEVREVRQFMIGGTIDMDDTIIEHGDWITMHDFDKARLEADLPDFLKRNAYTDAESHNNNPVKAENSGKQPQESHDRHISDNQRYPLFSHMSSEHGLTLLDSELDEIARHSAPMTGVEYWKERCKVAEQMIGMNPSDPKTYDEFCRLYDEWEQLIEQNVWPR